MNFAIDDVLLNRFRLVEMLRDEPGISVWLAHDNSLQRKVQIFIVSNARAISRVNTAASYLALSHDSHFTPVLHLHRDGEVCVIVSDVDSGITLRDYLIAHAADPQTYPLSISAIRSIIGEITSHADELNAQELTHFCINNVTVRLTKDGITLADFPVSFLLKPPTSELERATNHDTESLMVYHIASLAFELITKTPYSPQLEDRAASLLKKANADSDLALICTRALSLPNAQGATPVPLVTLMELLVLLDDWKPLADLARDSHTHINVSRETSAPSITQAVINHADASDIVAIPESLKTNNAEQEEDQHPEWSTSALIFGGGSAVDMKKSSADTDLYHALNQLDETQLERTYDPYAFNDFMDQDIRTAGMNTAAIRVAVSHNETKDTTPADEATPQNQVSTHEMGRAHKASIAHTAAIPQNVSPLSPPPSFEPSARKAAPVNAPQASQHMQAKTSNTSTKEDAKTKQATSPRFISLLKKRALGLSHSRIITVTFAAIVMVAILGLAVYSLTLGGSPEENSTDPWSTLSTENVPFPGQDQSQNNSAAQDSSSQDTQTQKKSTTKSDSQEQEKKSASSQKSSSKAATKTSTSKDSDIKPVKIPQDKENQAVPVPVGTENTAPLQIAARSFLNRPAGHRGWGYAFRFAQPTQVWRIELSNVAGGGKGYIYADPTSNDPTTGTEVGTFTFADNGQVTNIILRKPVQATQLVAWIDGTDATTLPSTIRLTGYAFY